MKLLFVILSLFILTFGYAQKDEILVDLNPTNFNQDFSNYNQITSTYCSQLSEIAYWSARKIEKLQKRIIAKYPNANYQSELISSSDRKNHAQVLLWGNNDFMVMAFRGTEPLRIRDWITDAKFWNYKNNPSSNEKLANMPPGHGGFRSSLISLIKSKDLFNKIEAFRLRCNPASAKSEFPIFLTGHSLGAALSQLFMECLTYKGFNFKGAYHFAPPLAVIDDKKEDMKQKYGDRVYDIVNYKDYVPRAGRNGVAHFGKFYRICKDGLIYKEKESYIRFRFFEYPSEFKLHSLKNHIKAVKRENNNIDEINNRSLEKYPCLKPVSLSGKE